MRTLSDNTKRIQEQERRKFLEGWEIPAIFNAATSLYQYNNIKNQKIAKSDSYFSNPYGTDAMRKMNSLNIDERPIIRKMVDAGARQRKAISMSGATPGSKYLARVATAANTQTSISDMMPKIYDMRNQLKAQAANFGYTLGEANRQYRTNAYNRDLDYYSKAHAAKQAGMQTQLNNFANNLWQAYSNNFTYDTYKNTLDMYKQDLNMRKDELAALLKQLNN